MEMEEFCWLHGFICGLVCAFVASVALKVAGLF